MKAVVNLEKVLKQLDSETLRRAGRRIVGRAGLEIRDLMAVYPPEGPWNKPAGPGSRWYQRLFGQRWMRADGTIGGRNTSEQLQKSWRLRVNMPTMTAVISTGVSYAPFVVGDQQAAFHRRHGWKTSDQIIRSWRRKRLNAIVSEEVERAWKR